MGCQCRLVRRFHLRDRGRSRSGRCGGKRVERISRHRGGRSIGGRRRSPLGGDHCRVGIRLLARQNHLLRGLLLVLHLWHLLVLIGPRRAYRRNRRGLGWSAIHLSWILLIRLGLLTVSLGLGGLREAAVLRLRRLLLVRRSGGSGSGS